MHTTTPQTTAQQPDPRFIRLLLITLAAAVIVVAIIANGTAYLGGVNFVQNVMHESRRVAVVFGGTLELSLAVVAGAMFVESYRMQPIAALRTGTWVLSGASGTFGALFEVSQYVNGTLTLLEAAAAAGWRLFAPFVAAALWELVIHLFCGARHRGHRAAERRHAMLFAFFKAVEREGLAQQHSAHHPARAWSAMIARRAARRIAKRVPPAERDEALATYLASQQYAHQVRIQGAALAAHTDATMRSDLTRHVTTLHPRTPQPTRARRTAHPLPPQVQPQPVEAAPAADYETRAAESVLREAEAIAAAAPATDVDQVENSDNKAEEIAQRRALVRDLLLRDPDTTGPMVERHLAAAGYPVSVRTAFSDLAVVRAVLAGP